MNEVITRQLREVNLYPPVKAWLEAFGYVVFPELWDRDIVAYRGEHIVVVELKMSLSRSVYFQQVRGARFANSVYAAVATKPVAASMERQAKYGFGVLRVDGGVEVLLQPRQREMGCAWGDKAHAKALASLRERQPLNVQAGLPTLAGDGPAIRCEAKVREYLKAHPQATWKDIFCNVPNHYAHHRSMRGAMPAIEYLRSQPLLAETA